ncbi:MAG TPA: cytochrome c oxidase assembly protein [Alphaproteobacteria bacterium]|nr:cytochrome c oxidase assembly protein [Alphaproteobacteria bacterium]
MFRYDHQATPYCGTPPTPGELWRHWNFDPTLIVALLAVLALYFIGARRLAIGSRKQAVFVIGWTIAVLALISPLCPLSVSLFSARVAQHMVLALVAAPLVAYGSPVAVCDALFIRRPREHREEQHRRWNASLAAGVFAAALWFWHAPVPYDETFSSSLVYWLMHVSAFGAALWLWTDLLDPSPARALQILGAGAISTLQMSFLGALITFAPRALYAPHLTTSAAWGLTPLQDQQLGGAIMWMPGCVVFLVVSMLVLRRALILAGWFEDEPRPIRARSR